MKNCYEVALKNKKQALVDGQPIFVWLTILFVWESK